jgi:hypothetical protein
MTRLTRTAIVLAAFAGILATTPGCAVMLGYMIADHIQRDKATETCRTNLQTINQARIAKGQEPFPDQCAK